MAESFDIRIVPPRSLYKEMIGSLFDTLRELQWTLDSVTRPRLDIFPEPKKMKSWLRKRRRIRRNHIRKLVRVGNISNQERRWEESRRITEEYSKASEPYFQTEIFQPGSVNSILEMPPNPKGGQDGPYWGVAVFHKDGRWFELHASVENSGVIRLGSDASFFEAENPLDDLKTLFSRLPLTENTGIVGDTEGWSVTPTWIFRGKIRWWPFHWIDKVSLAKWVRIVTSYPEFEENVLASFPKKKIVIMGESPYTPYDERVRFFV